MSDASLLVGLQESPLAVAISESAVVFPWIESVHVLAITMVVGTIALVDLRLLGLAWRRDSIARLTREVVPWTLGAFVLAVVTGVLLFISSAERYWDNWFFKAKLLLLALAGVNMLVFHFVTERRSRGAGSDAAASVGNRMAGGLSLFFWILVVFFGRWIGFTL